MQASLQKVLVTSGFLAAATISGFQLQRAWANFGHLEPDCLGGYCATWCRVCTANNKWHAVKFSAMTAKWTAHTQNAVNHLNSTTNMSVYRTYSDPYPDVVVKDWYYGDNGLWGWVGCYSNNTGTGWNCGYKSCRGMILRINQDTESPNYDDRTALVRHELGHTVGLRHSSDRNSVMHAIPTRNNMSLARHDKNHVNACYR